MKSEDVVSGVGSGLFPDGGPRKSTDAPFEGMDAKLEVEALRIFDAVWISVEDRLPGEGGILVTNNIDARDAHGRHSHIWLVQLLCKCETCNSGYHTTSNAGRRIENITHWRNPTPELPLGAPTITP